MEVFTIRMTSAFIVMMVPFTNLHTKLTVQLFIYFIYVAGHNKKDFDIWMSPYDSIKLILNLEIFALYTPSDQIYEYLTNSPKTFD